jgi:hypothetical protein
MVQEKLALPNPCPFRATEANRIGKDYYCKSGDKIVVDFRGMSLEEVKSQLIPKMCGIFDENHITDKYTLSFWQNRKFQIFSLLSLFGFSVKPMVAQNARISQNTPISVVEIPLTADTLKGQFDVNISNSLEDKKAIESKLKSTKTWPAIFRKKKKFRPIGCPEF